MNKEEKPIFDKWWKWKLHLLGRIPKRCPYCDGEVIDRGFEGHNLRHQCRKCESVLVTEIGLWS